MTGIEGTYRRTCESVLTVLRRNKDSLMAVLEAFVYDPLLNWRLMDSAAPGGKGKATTAASRAKEPGESSVASSQEQPDFLEEATSLQSVTSAAPPAAVPKKGLPSSSVENSTGKFTLFSPSNWF